MKYGKTLLAVFIILALIIGGYFYFDYRMTAEVKANVDQKIQVAQPDIKASYKKLTVNLFTREVSLQNLSLLPAGLPEKDTITIKHLNFKANQNKEGIITYLRAAADGIHTPVSTAIDQYPMFYQLTKKIGINSLNSSAAILYEYNPKTQHMSFDFLHAIQQLGSIRLALTVNQFPAKAMTIPEIEQVKIEKASLSYQDDSLFPKAMTILAQQQGMDQKQYTEQLLQSLQAELAKPNSYLTQNMYQALVKFINKPENITIKFDPTTPVIIGSLAHLSWQQIYQKLNVTVTANSPAGAQLQSSFEEGGQQA